MSGMGARTCVVHERSIKRQRANNQTTAPRAPAPMGINLLPLVDANLEQLGQLLYKPAL